MPEPTLPMKSVLRLFLWPTTLLCTAVVLLFTLSPASDDSTTKAVSEIMGGTDFTDGVAHLMGFSVLAALWLSTLRLHLSLDRARHFALIIALTVAISTELAQRVIPDRGSNIFDLAANATGVWIGLYLAGRYFEMLVIVFAQRMERAAR